MRKIYRIELDELDLGQLLDELKARPVAWEKTADYHRTRESPPGFIVEECNDTAEAVGMAKHYQSIINQIQKQREAQT